ncbi:MAG TPA: DUF547 domain-containing protein [Methylomirabilota bacterium]|nr:DUF547 domain-containing protein [Methylomirabilota bacterium]
MVTPYGVFVATGRVTRHPPHPVQLYEAVGLGIATAWGLRVWRGHRRLAGTAIVLATLGSAAPAQAGEAWDSTAYARVLEAHVRPATIVGIRLAAVDYAAVPGDPHYARALAALAAARPEVLDGDAARIAFWINAYNLLAVKAVVDRYPVRSIKDGGTLLQSIWKRKVGTVGDREYALDEIEHDILRARYRDPRVHMAIVCASLSCPDLRGEPYVAERLEAQLADATRRFLANPTKGLHPAGDGRTARVSAIFKWFAGDFGGPDGVARFIRATADPAVAERVRGLEGRGLSYLHYDWSLNDARRTERSP